MEAKRGFLISLGVVAAGAAFVVDRFLGGGLTASALLALGGLAAIFLSLVGAVALLFPWYLEWGLGHRIGVDRLLAGPLLVTLGLGIIAAGSNPLLSFPWADLKSGGNAGAQARGIFIFVGPILLIYVAILGWVAVACLWFGLRQFRSRRP
jgi:hypothetical protein